MENYKPDLLSEHKLSLEHVLRTITSECRETLGRLGKIWLELGIKDEQRQTRNETVINLMSNLLGDMVAEEENLKAQIEGNIERFKDVTSKLCQELAIEPFEADPKLTLIEMETELRMKVDMLNKEKHERLKELKNLRTEEEKLCNRLSLPQHELNFVGCPAKEQINELEQNVGFLQAEMTKRFDLFKKLQTSIRQLWVDLDMDPYTDFETQICRADADENFSLSAENLDKLKTMQDQLEEEHKNLLGEIDGLRGKVKALWDRLDISSKEQENFRKDHAELNPKTAKALKHELSRLEELKRLHMKKFVENIRKELVSLWEKCYFSEEQKQDFRPFYEDVFTEEALTIHEQQVQSMNSYFHENKKIFKLVEKREIAWGNKLEFENKSSNADRLFTARGGALLKEAKIRAAFEKGLPKVEEELKKSLKDWEKDNESHFLYYGERYVDRMAMQHEQWDALKEQKKQERNRVKQENTKQEMVFGSKPSAAKRKYAGTPVKSPKMRRMDLTQTPSKYIHSSINPSPISKRAPKSDSKQTPLKSALRSKSKTAATARRRSNRIARQTVRSGKENATYHPSPAKAAKMSFVSGSIALNGTPQPEHIGSYQEFSIGIVSPNCRSSFVSKSPSHKSFRI
eukprot:gene5658-6354_t